VYPMVNASPPRNADGAYHVLRTADGYVRVLPGTPRHWQAFLTLVRNPEALAGPEWEVPIFRLANGDVIRLVAADALGDRSRTAEPPTGSAAGPPLAGMRVVNLGVGAVVPEVCWLLGELGAEVVKIESRANLDFLRRVTIEPDTPNRAWTFNDENRGQESVCLDLATVRGRELALRLCAAADVVAENNRGG